MAFETGIRVKIDASGAKRGAEQVKRAFANVKDAARRDMALAKRSVAGLGTAFGRIKSSILSVKGAMVGLGGAFVARKLVGEFADFERGLIGVGKTTGLADMELERLGVRVQDIAERLPVATSQLLDIAQAAGQLGVSGAANIERFTETVGKLGLASDLQGDVAATALARILTITNTDVADVDRLASTMVRLGNNFAATESQIAEASKRVAQATAPFGVAAKDVVGIATALTAVGVEAELSGSSTIRAFQAISDAIVKGGDDMAALESITGKSRKAMGDLFKEKPARAFEVFIQGLKRGHDEGRDYAAMLETLGLSGVRVVPVLSTLAERNDELTRSLNMANDEWSANAALTEEALTAATSFSAQMQLVKNSVNRAAAAVGRELAPVILEVTDNFRAWLKEAGETGKIERWAETLGGAFKTAVEGLTGAFDSLVEELRQVKLALGALVGIKLAAWSIAAAKGIRDLYSGMLLLGGTTAFRLLAANPALVGGLATLTGLGFVAKEGIDRQREGAFAQTQAELARESASRLERPPLDPREAAFVERGRLRRGGSTDLVGGGLGAFRPGMGPLGEPESDTIDPDVLADLAEKARLAAEETQRLSDATRKVADDLTGIQEKPTFEKWVEDARDSSTTMQSVFNEAVDGIASGIGQMVANGKADFESLGRSIIAMLVEIQAKAMVLDLMSLFTGGPALAPDLMSQGKPGNAPNVPLAPDVPAGFQFEPQGFRAELSEPHDIQPPPAALRIPEQGSFKAPQPQVNVNISTPAGTQSNVQQTTGADGRLNLDIMVEQIEGAIASNIGAGGGLAPALENQYGLNRVAGATR